MDGLARLGRDMSGSCEKMLWWEGALFEMVLLLCTRCSHFVIACALTVEGYKAIDWWFPNLFDGSLRALPAWPVVHSAVDLG